MLFLLLQTGHQEPHDETVHPSQDVSQTRRLARTSRAFRSQSRVPVPVPFPQSPRRRASFSRGLLNYAMSNAILYRILGNRVRTRNPARARETFFETKRTVLTPRVRQVHVRGGDPRHELSAVPTRATRKRARVPSRVGRFCGTHFGKGSCPIWCSVVSRDTSRSSSRSSSPRQVSTTLTNQNHSVGIRWRRARNWTTSKTSARRDTSVENSVGV